MVSDCAKCGAEIHDESFAYCPYCGTGLEKTVSQLPLSNGRFLRKTGHAVFVLGIEFIVLALFAAYFFKTHDFGTFKFTDYPLADYSFPLFYLGVASIATAMVLTALSRKKPRT